MEEGIDKKRIFIVLNLRKLVVVCKVHILLSFDGFSKVKSYPIEGGFGPLIVKKYGKTLII